MADDGRWNHNIHCHRGILDAVPEGALTALEVGAGDGLLTRELHHRVPHVSAIDVDGDVLTRVRSADPDVEWVVGDVLDQRVVSAMAGQHHDEVDVRRSLSRRILPLRGKACRSS